MGSVGTPASRQAHFCFCEGILRVWALSSARWPDDPHAGPMTCTWAPPPRRMSRGLRAYQRVNAHVQGFACEQRAEIDTESAKVQTHCLKLTDFRLFSPNGSAVWRAHRFTSQPHRHQTGGIALHEAPTRRSHGPRRLRVVQKPPPLASRSAEIRKVQPHREDSTRSEGVESSRSGVGLAVTRAFMNVEEACLPD